MAYSQLVSECQKGLIPRRYGLTPSLSWQRDSASVEEQHLACARSLQTGRPVQWSVAVVLPECSYRAGERVVGRVTWMGLSKKFKHQHPVDDT